MIRPIQLSEIERFAGLGRWFHSTVGLSGEFNREVFVKTWSKLTELGTGFVFGRMDEDGTPMEALGCVVCAHPHDGRPTAFLTFWYYLEEPKGLEAGLLHKALEKHCTSIGMQVILIDVLCNPRLAKVGDFLARSGYSLASMQYRKEL